jgi:hypothetical protein
VTIRKGEEWGSPAPRPTNLLVAGGDRELAELVAREPDGAYGVNGGDLFLSLGSPPDRVDMQRLPLDALLVRLDGREPIIAVAHVVARHDWWRGPIVIVANCGFVRGLNAAPRAHPNDGRFDVIEVSPRMSLRQRLHAHRRARSGTHLPHPDLVAGTARSQEWDLPRPFDVYVDGVAAGRCRRLAVEMSPDHFAIYT